MQLYSASPKAFQRTLVKTCYRALDTVNEAFDFLTSLNKRVEISRTDSSKTAQVAVPPPQIDCRTYFFKGGAEFRLEKCIGQDVNIQMAALHSLAPTDLHPEKSTYVYLTKYHKEALLYARYVEERVPPSKAAVLHMVISDDLTANSHCGT